MAVWHDAELNRMFLKFWDESYKMLNSVGYGEVILAPTGLIENVLE